MDMNGSSKEGIKRKRKTVDFLAQRKVVENIENVEKTTGSRGKVIRLRW